MGTSSIALIHGLGGNRWIMSRLARFFRCHGYLVKNWGYPSLRGSISSHAEPFRRALIEQASDPATDTLHIVAHSMGCIVARHALMHWMPDQMGRCVMLGPPNRGSPVARYAARWLGRQMPVLQELSDAPDSFVNQLEDPGALDIGVIAAGSDRVVPIPNTHLSCERAHLILPGHHAMLVLRRETAEQALAFLRTGRFVAPSTESQTMWNRSS